MLKFRLQFPTLHTYLNVSYISCFLKYCHTYNLQERLRRPLLDVASTDSALDGFEVLQLLPDMLLLVFSIIAGSMSSRTKKIVVFIYVRIKYIKSYGYYSVNAHFTTFSYGYSNGRIFKIKSVLLLKR